MSIIQDMRKRLTDVYNKSPTGNMSRVLQMAAEEAEILQTAITTVADWRDIDNAEGTTLDRIGRNVAEPRGDKTDDIYRQHIKVKIIANRSRGDATTIETVTRVMMPDTLIGIREGWNDPAYDEPASIVISFTGSEQPVPFSPIERVVAAGVRVYWEMNLYEDTIGISSAFIRWLFDYWFCGEHYCGTIPTISTIGEVYDSECAVLNAYYSCAFTYLNCGVYDCGTMPIISTLGEVYDGEYELTSAYAPFSYTYPITGAYYCGTLP